MDVLQHPAGTMPLPAQLSKPTLYRRFINWCARQEDNRLLWLAIMIVGHGCVITPITLAVVMLTGNNFVFWPWALAAMGVCLIVNLAALPTKITLPVFLLSLVTDAAVIVFSVTL